MKTFKCFVPLWVRWPLTIVCLEGEIANNVTLFASNRLLLWTQSTEWMYMSLCGYMTSIYRFSVIQIAKLPNALRWLCSVALVNTATTVKHMPKPADWSLLPKRSVREIFIEESLCHCTCKQDKMKISPSLSTSPTVVLSLRLNWISGEKMSSFTL